MSFKYNLKGTSIGFSNIVETILKNRDIENINDFLNPNASHLEDESLYDHMELGFENLLYHIKKDSAIVIVVDCDADGYTSASVMYQYITHLIMKFNSKSTITFIVHDDKAHGLDEITLNRIIKIECGCNLIILPDASSNDYAEHKYFKNKGIDILVIDHHGCERYSENAIVINNQLSTQVTNKTMTGVGVCYKFIKYIDKKLNLNCADDYLDLVAIGMIGDVSDLRNLESRYLVLKGIELIIKGQNKNKFISALIKDKAYDMKNEVSIIGIGFYIVPLINALIRNGTYEEKELMFKAFLNINEKHIDKIRGKGEVELSLQDYVVRIGNKCKRKQKKLVDEAVEVAKNQVDKYQLFNNGIIIINATGLTEKNYTGLLANKLTNIYQRPCFLLSSHDEDFAGSARGYDKKDIKDVRKWCIDSGLFNYALGHPNACGISIHNSKINDLYEVVSKIQVSNFLIYDVDGIFNDKTLNKTIIESVAKHKNIWGNSVDEPLFAIENLVVNSKDIELMGKNKNTIKINHDGIALMKFFTNEDRYNDMKQHQAINVTIIGKFSINEYNGKITPQIIIEDFMYTPSVVKFRF